MRVLVADSYHVYRRGLLTMLARAHNAEVVGEADSGAAAVAAAARLSPDLVLLAWDIRGGVEATIAQLKASSAPPRVVVITWSASPAEYAAALAAGADDCLSRSATPGDVLAVI